MLSQEIVQLLIQVPLLGVFVWFTLKLSGDFRADTAKRDEQWQKFIEQQNELWRNFIRELVERSLSADDTVSQRLGELGIVIRSLIDDFKNHDQRTTGHR